MTDTEWRYGAVHIGRFETRHAAIGAAARKDHHLPGGLWEQVTAEREDDLCSGMEEYFVACKPSMPDSENRCRFCGEVVER